MDSDIFSNQYPAKTESIKDIPSGSDISLIRTVEDFGHSE